MRSGKLLGTILLLHGLAHAAPGMWISGRVAPEPIALLWWFATMAFLTAGFRLLRWPAARIHPAPLALIGASASTVMLLLSWLGVTSMVGIALNLALAWLVVTSSRDAPVHSAEGDLVAGPEPPRRRRRRSPLARAAGVVLATLFFTHVSASILLRPWHMAWGTPTAARAEALPGDELLPGARYVMDHAILVRAPRATVWPWLAQLGRDRGGFYSYDWLERLLGVDIHNADSIVPAWQHREVGELVPATQPGYLGLFRKPMGWRVLVFEPGSALTLENWGTFALHEVDSTTTLLHVRTRGPGQPSLLAVPLGPIGLLGFEPGHFLMERGMLRGIRDRAERVTRQRS